MPTRLRGGLHRTERVQWACDYINDHINNVDTAHRVRELISSQFSLLTAVKSESADVIWLIVKFLSVCETPLPTAGYKPVVKNVKCENFAGGVCLGPCLP